jgi:hypothetical protein
MEIHADKGEREGDWYSLGITKDGLWTKYVPYKEREETPKQPSKTREQLENERKQQLEAELKRLRETSLPIDERDYYYRKLSKELGLLESDKQKLLRRGLSEEDIQEGMFFSITPYKKLTGTYPLNLPGISISSNSEKIIGSPYFKGIGCPVWSEGKIIGIQVRREEENNKYVWLKGKDYRKSLTTERSLNQNKLGNGEIPIAHIINNKDNKSVILCEGILKPFIASKLHKSNVIGASGGNFLSSPKQLEDALSNYDEILIAPDAGSVENIYVIYQWIKVIKFLDELRQKSSEDDSIKAFNISFIWYGQTSKKDGKDLDEIVSIESNQEITYLTPKEFLTIAFNTINKKANKSSYEYNFIKNYLIQEERFEELRILECELLKKYSPDLIINEKYLASIFENIPLLGKCIGVKSPKNTGKTFTLRSLVQRELLKDSTIKFLYLGCRKTLCGVSSTDLRFGYINSELPIEKVEEFWEFHNGCSIVVDSFQKIREIDFSNVIVVVDEANQVFNHTITSGTHISKYRSIIFALLAEKLAESKGIICMDADLTDLSLNYFAQLGNKPKYAVFNEFQAINTNYIKYDNRLKIHSKLMQFAQNGERFVCVSDSEREVTAMYELVKGFGNYLLFTQDSIGNNPQLLDYLHDNGSLIERDNIDGIFYSPVMQSGISIELKEDYFKHTLAIFFGVVSPDVARQMLKRFRGDTTLHIYAQKSGMGYSKVYQWKQINQDFKFSIDDIHSAIDFFGELENRDADKVLVNLINLMQNKSHPILILNQESKAKLRALNNLEKTDFAKLLYQGLDAEGYQLMEEDGENNSVNNDVIDLKRQRIFMEARCIRKAKNITEEEAKKLELKPNLKYSEKWELNKYRLLQLLPEMELTDEFIAFYWLHDKGKIIRGIYNLFFGRHLELAKNSDFNSIIYQLSLAQTSGIYWHPDIRSKTVLSKIYAVVEPLIKRCVENGYFEEDMLNDFLNQCKGIRRQLRSLGVTFNDKTKPRQLLRKVLAIFGLKSSEDCISFNTPVGLVNPFKHGGGLSPNREGHYGLWKLAVKNYGEIMYQCVARKYAEGCPINDDLLEEIISRENVTTTPEEPVKNDLVEDKVVGDAETNTGNGLDEHEGLAKNIYFSRENSQGENCNISESMLQELVASDRKITRNGDAIAIYDLCLGIWTLMESKMGHSIDDDLMFTILSELYGDDDITFGKLSDTQLTDLFNSIETMEFEPSTKEAVKEELSQTENYLQWEVVIGGEVLSLKDVGIAISSLLESKLGREVKPSDFTPYLPNGKTRLRDLTDSELESIFNDLTAEGSQSEYWLNTNLEIKPVEKCQSPLSIDTIVNYFRNNEIAQAVILKVTATFVEIVDIVTKVVTRISSYAVPSTLWIGEVF